MPPKKRGGQKAGDGSDAAQGVIGGEHKKAVFQAEFREDLRYWVETDRRVALRLPALVEAVLTDPFGGIGKPEPLKYLGSNVWSRRITQEHRLVYLVRDGQIDFLQGRYHY